VGFALFVAALERAPSRRLGCAGVLFTCVVNHAVSLHWLVSTLGTYRAGGPPAWVLFAGILGVVALITQAPILLGCVLPRRLPGFYWLPGCWAAGEWLEEHVFDFAWGQWLYSQWAVQPVLHALARFGWYPVLLLCLTGAAAFGCVLAHRRPASLAVGAATVAVVVLVPARAIDDRALLGVGAVSMADAAHPPSVIPEGLDLLVWPEGATNARPSLEEGRGTSQVRLPTLPGTTRQGHLVGLMARSHAGARNAAVLVDPLGQVLAMRAKRLLVPGWERPVLGFDADAGGFVPGRAAPALPLGARPGIALICYEVFSRSLVLEGKEAGGQFIAVMSSDRALLGGDVAMRQILGALVLRSVEMGLPAVRASLWGSAALISSDGRILGMTRPGTSEVLTLPPAAATGDASPPGASSPLAQLIHRRREEGGRLRALPDGGRAERTRGERTARGRGEGASEEGAHAATFLGRAAAPDVRFGPLRLCRVCRQAPGVGVRDSTQRGALHSAAPGTAHAPCEAGPGAGASPMRVVLSHSRGYCSHHHCRPHPLPRPARQGRLGQAGVCPLEMNRFCAASMTRSS
jgi:apolipoprotein N-acyltransferase